MLYTEEQRVTLYYLGNLIQHKLPKALMQETIKWLEHAELDIFEDLFVNVLNTKTGSTLKINGDKKMLPKHLRRHKITFASFGTINDQVVSLNQLQKLFPPQNKPAGQLNNRINLITASFNLNAKETKILHFFGSILKLSLVQQMVSYIADYSGNCLDTKEIKTLSYFINMPPMQIAALLDKSAPLITKGLFEIDSDGDIRFSDNLKKMLSSRIRTTQDVRSLVLDEKATSELGLDDFDYIGENLTCLDKLLSKALQTKQKGVNILLFGEPGTGKTELAKALAQSAGADLYMLSENRTNERRDNRISELCMAGSLLENEPGTMLLMDEAEDVFYKEKWDFSKIFFNRLLEKNRTPVIWISNDITAMDPAFVRRFTYTLQMDTPPMKIRQEIWRKLAAKHKVKLNESEIKTLAQKYKLAPSFAVNALKAARLTKSKQTMWQTLESLENATLCCKGQYKPPQTDNKTSTLFNPKLVNADIDIVNLSRSIAKKEIRRFSLCLYGAPGTGKSAYARHLAEQLGLEVLHKRASDLISMWVGGTEKNIAAAFKDARDNEAMLIFDEADSFLQDRVQAKNSWEITAVNEMLTWMESHPYPFVCTTNLMASLDAASLRRFTFKVKYDFLNTKQVSAAFTYFFGQAAPNEIDNLKYLAPGDFEVVRTKAEILKIKDATEIVNMLRMEQDMKGVKTENTKLGFMI